MTAFPNYATGTVSVAAAGTVVTGVGTIWSGVNARPGDLLQIGAFGVFISDVTDVTHLAIPPWGGSTVAAVAYKIYQTSPLRFAGGQAMADVSALVAALNALGFIVFVSPGGAPDPSIGEDGQYATDQSTGTWWKKIAGVWTLTSAPVAGYGGTSTTSLLIANTVTRVFTTQANLAYNGARVRAASAAAPANYMEGICSYSGTTLTMTVDAIGGSGTKTDWVFSIAGSPGGTQTADSISIHGADIASAATINLEAATGNFVHVTGTAAITAITLADGHQRTVFFTGALTLTNGASLVLPGGANITTAAGDIAVFIADGTTVRCSDYQAANPALARALIAAQAQGDYAGMSNGTLVASASAGALTVSVNTFAGAAPSVTDPVYFYFRNSTLGLGNFTRIAVTSALSVVLGSTKTLGAGSGAGLRVWITAHNNAGTVQLGAINCSDTNGVFCPQEAVKYTTAVPANGSRTFYSTSAITTAAPWRFLGFCEWAPLTTAGTWVAPDIMHLFGPGSKKPGDVVQKVFVSTSTPTSTTVGSAGASVATNLTGSITPSSTANLIECLPSGFLFSSAASVSAFAQVGRNSNSNLFGAVFSAFSTATSCGATAGAVSLDKPNTTSSVTYTVFLWNAGGVQTVQFSNNGTSTMMINEIMG